MSTFTLNKNTYNFKVYLGTLKNDTTRVYLEGFKWECNWYWSGGIISTRDMWTHFDGCFLNPPDPRGHPLGSFYDPWTIPPDYVKRENIKRISNGASIWENLSFFLDDVPEYLEKNWWRIKDLFKQFYCLKDAAEAFQHGGHCTSDNRNPKEINLDMADKINGHIETVIIPELMKALNASTHP